MSSLAKNTFYNIVYKCLNMLFPLVTTIYVSRILLPVGIGRVSSAQNIVQYFVIIAALGIPTYGIKKVAECGSDKERRSKVFFELFVINSISTILCTLVYVLMVHNVTYFYDKKVLSLVVGVQLVANVINVDWFYQGIEEYRFIMIRSFIVKVLALCSVLMFVKTQNDFIIYALISALSAVANYIFNIINIRKYIIVRKQQLLLGPHIKSVMYLLAATIAIEIYTLADTTMLNLMKGDEVVGYYTSAMKIVGIIRTLIAAICAVYLPKLSYYYANDEKEKFYSLAKNGINILLTFSIPAAVGLNLLAKDCVAIIFGNTFSGSIMVMQILSISIITVALSNFMGYQILVTAGKEKIVMISTVIAAVINIIMNYFLIIPYAHYGAAIASVVSEGFITIFQLCMVQRLGIKIVDANKLFSIIFSAGVMGVAVFMVSNITQRIAVRLVGAFIAGMVVYFTCSLLTKNDVVLGIVKVLKKRLVKKG